MEPLLTQAQVAEILGVSADTLALWRKTGRGPAFVRFGRKHSPIRYRRSAVEEWIESRTRASDEDEAARAGCR